MYRPSQTVIGVQLDLKGMNPKPEYFDAWLRDLASLKYNAVLVEYEDVFPFQSVDVAYDRESVWSREHLANFVETAHELGIMVIPLQQCLGHLEYVFRWKKHEHLAQDTAYPSTLKLGDPDARAMALGMLGEVIDAHPHSPVVHLGMDEAHDLKKHAAEVGRHVADVFLDWLNELCDFVEARGRTPMIWTDMLEDHFKGGVWDRFKDRVIFSPWDYSTVGDVTPTTRIGGHRVGRSWLENPADDSGPAIGAGTAFVEDLPADKLEALSPWRRGDGFVSLHQVDLWTSLGFTVIGACQARASSHLSVLPDYNLIHENMRCWGRAVKRTGAAGVIATSWARGNTFCPPNYCVDLHWPCLELMARELGAEPEPFFEGADAAKQADLWAKLGRSRKDWSLEAKLADEMDAMAGDVGRHAYEWRAISLMAKVYHWRRRADFALLEVDYFHANFRPTPNEWGRRIAEQQALREEMVGLRQQVADHFDERYAGDAYREWKRDLFDWHEARLHEVADVARRKQAWAAAMYAR